MDNNYRIVFLDIDGTLTDTKKNIMPQTLEALLKIQDKGIILAIASGRPQKGVMPYAEMLHLDEHSGLIMPFNGAQIVNYQTKEVIYQNNISMEVLKKAYTLSKEYGVQLITYKGDYIISETEDDSFMLIESRINKMDVIKVDCIIDYIQEPPVKCLLVGDGEYMGRIEGEIREKIDTQANVFRSEPFFIEVVPKGIDKAASINYLIDKLGIDQDQTIAFGDGYNDISMIKYAGLGVAMKNGCEEIKKVADRIAPDNNSEGIACILNEVFKDII